jgi:hypothetical protein
MELSIIPPKGTNIKKKLKYKREEICAVATYKSVAGLAPNQVNKRKLNTKYQ